MVKNVTGYDLAKLYIGSRGTLCVIASAWIRLVPSPQRVLLLEASSADLGAACRAGLRASRFNSARSCVVSFEGDAEPRVLVELAGDETTVVNDADQLHAELETRTVEVAALDAVRARSLGGHRLAVRLPLLPSRFEAVVERLSSHPCSLLAYPGLGYLHVALDRVGDAPGDEFGEGDSMAPWFEMMDEIAREARGGYVVERAPVDLKQQRDVFSTSSSPLPVLKAIKQRFDPDGVLAPGRSAGRI